MQQYSKLAWYAVLACAVLSIAVWTFLLARQSLAIKSYREKGFIDKLNNELESEQALLERDEQFLKNYIPAKSKTAGLLTKIGDMNEQYSVNLVSTGPIIREESGNYVKSYRKIVFESGFHDMFCFLNDLEKIKGINVSDLLIDKMDDGMYLGEMEANSFSLKDAEEDEDAESAAAEDPEAVSSTGTAESMQEQSLVMSLPFADAGYSLLSRVVGRDPFSPVPALVKGSAEGPVTLLNKARKRYLFTGTIDYADYSIAVIEGQDFLPRVLRSGDSIEGWRIERIAQETLLLSKGRQTKQITIGEPLF